MKVRSRQAFLYAAVATVVLGGSQLARADNLTWDANGNTAPLGQDGSGTWDTTNPNWVSGDLVTGTNVIWSNANPDSAIFGSAAGTAGATPYNISLGAPIVAQDITFNNSADNQFYTLDDFAGGSLTLKGNIIKGAASGNPQILLLNAPLTLSAGTHTFTANVSPGDNAPELNVTAVVTGAGGVTIDNQTYQAYGTIAFTTGGNDYAGNTNINNGRLEITHSEGLGSTSAGTTIGALGTLSIGGSNTAVAGPVNIAEPITITRNTYTGGEFGRYTAAIMSANGSGTTTFSGPFVIDSNDARVQANTSTIVISTNLTTSAAHAADGKLTVDGDFAGFVTLTGDNSAIGAAGGIQLVGGVELNVSSDANLGGPSSPLTFAGNATLHPVGGFMTSFGTHVINNATFSGGIDVDSGQTFTVDVPLGDANNAVGEIGKRGLGTLDLNSTINLRGSQTFWDSGIVNVNAPVTLASLHLRSPVVNIGTGGSVTTTAGFDSFGADSTGTNGGPDIAVVNLTGTGQLIQTTGDDFNISDNANTKGTINIRDDAVFTTGGITFVGKSAGAVGTINQFGGTVTINRSGNFGLVLGDGRFSDGPTGIYTMTGGTLNVAGEMYAGEGHTANAHGTGSFTMSGGTVNLNNWFVVGREGGVGTVDISGGTFNHTGGNTSIGDSAGGTDTMTLSGTGQYISTAGEFWVGTGGGSVGTLIMKDNAVLSVTNWFPVGRAGALGTLDISGHASVTKSGSNNSYVGESTNAVTSSMTVRENGSFTATTGEFWVGQGGGIGILNIQDSGSFTVNNWFALGRANSASQGTVNLSGGTLTKQGSNFLAVGSGGQGTLNQTAGTLSSNGTRLAESSSGTMNLSGGTATFTGEFSLGYVAGGVGTLNISGTANVALPAAILGVNSTTAANGGILNLNGGTLTGVNFTAGAAAIGLRTFNFNGGLLKAAADNTNFIGAKVLSVVSTGGALINPNGHIVTINSALTHDTTLAGADGGLSVSGTGSLTLATNASTYTGNTAVNGGTLSINAGNASPNYTVAGGATLNVNGTIPAAANVTTAGATNFAGNTTATTSTRTLGTLTINAGGVATVTQSSFAATPAILRPATLTFNDPSAKLDLKNNEVIAPGSAAIAFALIQANQLVSTQPADPTKAIGYITLGGADAGKFEARYTLKGDTNLDGAVGVGDLGALATSYGITGGMSWANGDFTGDQNVDVADLGALATNYNVQLSATGPSLGGAFASAAAEPLALVAGGSAAVPEPASLGLLGIGSLAMFARRRRRSAGRH